MRVPTTPTVAARRTSPETEGDWQKRKTFAHRAYDEWMPTRMSGTARSGDGDRLYRSMRFGTLANLSMLDLRSYRSKQVAESELSQVDDPTRSITGDPQMQWLKDQRGASSQYARETWSVPQLENARETWWVRRL